MTSARRAPNHPGSNHDCISHVMKYIPVLLFVIGALCLVLFAASGSEVAPNGQLQEPFALLPLGWLCIALGTCGLMIGAIGRLWRRIARR